MQHSFAFETSFWKDSYSIFRNSIQIGKLYKTEWLVSTVETTISGNSYIFISKGVFNRTISIVDKKTKQSIGAVTINSFFKVSPSATFSLTGNKHYRWTTGGIFSYDWKWFNLSDNEIVAISTEPLDLFKQKGMISWKQPNDKDELLIVLGIYFRNSVQRNTIITRILSLFLLALTLLKLV